MTSCWVVVMHTLISALRKQRNVDLCEFKVRWSTEQVPGQAPKLQQSPVLGEKITTKLQQSRMCTIFEKE